jgi:hypothetical protein
MTGRPNSLWRRFFLPFLGMMSHVCPSPTITKGLDASIAWQGDFLSLKIEKLLLAIIKSQT